MHCSCFPMQQASHLQGSLCRRSCFIRPIFACHRVAVMHSCNLLLHYVQCSLLTHLLGRLTQGLTGGWVQGACSGAGPVASCRGPACEAGDTKSCSHPPRYCRSACSAPPAFSSPHRFIHTKNDNFSSPVRQALNNQSSLCWCPCP